MSASIPLFVAAALSFGLALSGLVRSRRTIASWCFFLGMLGLAGDTLLSALIQSELDPQRLLRLHEYSLELKGLLSAIWLCFSVTYSRGNARQSFAAWRPAILVAALLPAAFAFVPAGQMFEVVQASNSPEIFLRLRTAAQVLNGAILIAAVLMLMNLERTFRAAVGTMQWRIKFVVLGLAVVFGARFYARSQALVYSGLTNSLGEVEAIGLLIGCLLLALGYLRSGFGETDVYPSSAVLHTSITVLLVGGYLFVVGVLAQIVAHFGGATRFQLEAFLVLLGISILAVLLLSERIRQRTRRFVSHHFKRPQYDFRKVWTRFTQSTSSAIDDGTLCAASAGLISETFNVLSVSLWLFDQEKEQLFLAASTSRSRTDSSSNRVNFTTADGAQIRQVFDLERVKESWGTTLREISATQFNEGGHRLGVPLRTGDRWFGLIILADRVNGVPYTIEEHELLDCIGDQITSSLLNLRLAKEIMLGKELEAFQTISAFFVHDLKNAASTLNLMLQNLPVHFDDPEFRVDALRGIGETTNRINQIIERLGAVRSKLELERSEVDLNTLISEAIDSFNGSSEVKFVRDLNPLSRIVADREQLRSVVTNLLLNACDAVGVKKQGEVQVRTSERSGWVALSVCDDGCGMAPEFVRDSLFRPFKTTKKKGLGIGMFQTKMIVEAHQGRVQVTSDVGKGTTFQILLPLQPQ